MSTRPLFSSPLRFLPSSRPLPPRTAFFSSSSRPYAPAPDAQDAHGSIPSSRKLRPRDRLQFTESAVNQAEASASDGGGTVEGAPSPPVGFDSSAASSPFPSTSSSSSSADPSSSSSSSDPHFFPPNATDLVINPPVSGLPPLPSHHIPIPRIPFSTHRFVRKLEDAGVPQGMAEELMKATREMLLREEEKARRELLSRQDLENEAYLFTAAMSELKTGSQVKSRNDSITLKSLTASLQREVDAVEQKLKEDMQRLGSDIQLDMNSRKEETGMELGGLDKKVMDLNSKFTILLSEVRTEIEATKWISTRRVMTAIVITVVCVVAIFSSRSASKKKAEQKNKSKSSSGDSRDHPLSLEELGVRVEPGASEEAEVLPDGTAAGPRGGWAFWSSQSPPPAGQGQGGGLGMGVAPGKRVGEGEDEH
ncbi:hypothetical protein JCM8547_008858 [Rhodosporidiobolus lusitaniae]